MKLLVIIVTYNAIQWAERCFNSLQNSSIVPDVFVVDNGSTDGTQAYIQEHYPEVLFQQSKENLGFGKANNLGLKYALDKNYDYVYLLNQDAWVMPDTFEKLIEVSRVHPDYGVLSPMQMRADKKHLDEKFAKIVIGNHQIVYPLLVDDLFFGRMEEVYEVSFVMAAHWLITRRCLEIVGGFSPSFPHYGEDNNYIERVLYWNMKCGVVPEARSVHDRADVNWSDSKQQYVDYYIRQLDAASNPLRRRSILSVIAMKTLYIIKEKKYGALKYQLRLYKERKSIVNNYKRSLEIKAFL